MSTTETSQQSRTVAEAAQELASMRYHAIPHVKNSDTLRGRLFNNLSQLFVGQRPLVLVHAGTEDDRMPLELEGDVGKMSDWTYDRMAPVVSVLTQELGGRLLTGRPMTMDEARATDFNLRARRGEFPVTVFDKNGPVEPKPKRRLRRA